jgi:hypothetical protein
MALNNNGRYHLGAEGRWPVNNRPFLGGPSRITDFTKISARAMPAYGDFRDYLYDLDKLNGEQALAALAAFLRIRMEVAREQKEARQRALGVVGSGRLADVLGELDPFLARSSEGGRLGQALVAAVLDCVFDDVRLRSINDPGAGDVRVMEGDDVLLPAEVKQTPVGSETALALAREAAEMGADKALLAVMHGKHRPLPRDDIRRRALEGEGVALEVCESARELIGSACAFSSATSQDVAERLPGAYAARLREHEASADAQRQWSERMARLIDNA